MFRGGDFALVHYEVDPTEDEEMNAQPVLDFETAPYFQTGWACVPSPPREFYFLTESIQFSVSRQSVMRIGVPWVPVSKRTKRAG